VNGETEELPEGWTIPLLQEVCSAIQDGTHHSPKEQTTKGDFKYITAKNIKEWGIDLSTITYVPEHVHREIWNRCNPEFGDILYIKDGATTGIATVNPWKEQFSLLSSVALLKPIHQCLDSYYLKWYLNSPIGFKSMTDQMTGSAITRLTLVLIRESSIPLPPLAEQKRIVAKVEALLAEVNAARQRLEKVPTILKRFRQAVLAAACSGRLTEDWREENPTVEDASTLLDRVSSERMALWCETARAKAKAESRTLQGDSWKSRYQSPLKIETGDLFDLPATWTWAPFDTFSASFQYGPRFGEDEYTTEGVPTIRTSDMNFRGNIRLAAPPRVLVQDSARDHFL
jgi:type I restriction enzyme S subunit